MTGTDPEGPDDRALLRAHLDGDPEAFGTLFSRHRDRLWAVALRTTGDREEAADALQDALISAFRRADTYRGDAAVTTWLHRIVVNACLDRLRRRRVRMADPLPDDLDERRAAGRVTGVAGVTDGRDGTGATPAALVDPADLAVDHERRSALLSALAELPLDQRAALVLVDLEGYSVEETARILHCAPGTVKSRCSRGRARLLPLLTAHAPAPRAAGPESPGPPSRTPAVPPSETPAGGSDGARAAPGRNPGGQPRVRPPDDPATTSPATTPTTTPPGQRPRPPGEEVTSSDA